VREEDDLSNGSKALAERHHHQNRQQTKKAISLNHKTSHQSSHRSI
jgi:hypothetical protein